MDEFTTATGRTSLGALVSKSVLLEADLLESGAGPWVGHVPFAFWIIEQLRPRIFVELGTHYGQSYFGFCQSVLANGLSTKCYAVDTWQGDEHAGLYDEEVFAYVEARNRRLYHVFSKLLRMRFDDALSCFNDGTVDLLHIDGLHTYEAVRHDFETWLPKLSSRGVVLFHDVNVRERGFGVWRLWEELTTRYPHIEFEHSHGLGVLFVGDIQPPSITELIKEWSTPEGRSVVKHFFAKLGHLVGLEYQANGHSQAIAERDGLIAGLNNAMAEREAQLISFNQAVADRDGQIVAILSSTSWRLPRPIRLLGDQIKRMRRWFRFSLRTVLFAPKRFDAEWYLKQNPDVAMSGMDPYEHYMLFGKAEGRQPAPDAFLLRNSKRARLLLRITPQIIAHKGGVWRTCAAVLRVLQREGLGGINYRIKRLQTGSQPIADVDECRNDYSEWIRRYDTLTDATRAKMRQSAEGFARKPLISVVMPCYNPNPEWLRAAIESVRRQIYPRWELCIADDASTDPAIRCILEDYSRGDARIKVVFRETNGHISAASNSAVALAVGEYVALLDHDDTLTEHALFWVADAINRYPEAGLIYSDEDKITESGSRLDPYFKCDWNYDLFLSQNMISHLGVYKAESLRQVGGFREGLEGSQDYDLALRCVEQLDASQIIHIPRVLYHWRVHSASVAQNADAKPYAYVAAEQALNDHLTRIGASARAERHPACSWCRVRYALPELAPLVTIIIPTRNSLNLIRQCVSSILDKTDYPNYEILIVDNGSDDPRSVGYFDTIGKDPRIRILRDDRAFNYSVLNNRAVQDARGELVGLINNDIEVISPEWLTEMVSIALQPGVGAVGARLWYHNNTLQHGGVILGVGGVANHSHKRLPKGHPGYSGRAILKQSFSAVTAACLVVRRSIFLEVGGFEEENLKIAFGDVDFCLRIRQAGYRTVWTPYAELYRHESATRGYEDTPEKQARFAKEARYMKERWGGLLLNDPAYSPNLTLEREDFSFAWPPRVATLEDLE